MTGMACKCFVLISNWFLMPTRTSTPLIDRESTCRCPPYWLPADDPTWGSVNDEASRALEYTRGKLVFSAKDKVHRRGRFPALTYGISHGGGQAKPGMLCHSQRAFATETTGTCCLAGVASLPLVTTTQILGGTL